MMNNKLLIQFALCSLVSVVSCLGMVSCACDDDQAPASNNKKSDEKQTVQHRLVTMGGDVTEIVFALGVGDDVVGIDKGSQYPPQVSELTQLNYHRQIASEGVLALEPTMVLITQESGPKEAIEQIESAGVKVVMVESSDTVEGAYRKVRSVAKALRLQEEGESLIKTMAEEIEQVNKMVGKVEQEDRPRVLFVYARRGMGAPMVGGSNTSADAMITLAGGVNAGNVIDGFKPITPESLYKLQPDYILMLDKGFDAVGGEEGLLSLPGMADTKAGKMKQFLSYPDDLLLSFGPRMGEAAMKLYRGLYGQETGEVEVNE